MAKNWRLPKAAIGYTYLNMENFYGYQYTESLEDSNRMYIGFAIHLAWIVHFRQVLEVIIHRLGILPDKADHNKYIVVDNISFLSA